ncbi:response regulator [Chroococcidiopsis sp. FACHB-1243]|uniref:response regulator n=1 Tax=Chroococcidiopsis sp. [FACHB-1243] TaxID=2692781 RepID=UPI00177F1FA1|nr:response regulator [Chroococcidiopsis sp. [FACHB-1243]]MBD2305352.1 response regulator [Chroococcidiopsis sp. [FACHB-1243]]
MDMQTRFSFSLEADSSQPLVLAVDDNDDNLQLLAQILAIADCDYMTAVDGTSAILKAKSYRPSLILLDMMLPDISGIDVTRTLKQDPQTQAIPIIAVTAMARTEDKESFIAAGCVECAIKPYDIVQLEAVIRKYAFGEIGKSR